MKQIDFTNAKILVVDDNEANLNLLEQALEQFGFKHINCLSDSRLFFEEFEKIRPEIILLDLMMPHVTGYDILNALKTKNPRNVPVIVLTSDITKKAKLTAFNAGAKDFLSKPFDLYEVNLRVRNLLQTYFLLHEIEEYNANLNQQVNEQTHFLKQINDELYNANSRLKVLEESKLHFLKIISHEIRTPLNGIKGFAELIKSKIDSQELLDYFNYLEKSVERLEEFSYQALLITQLQTNTYKTDIEELDILQQITSVLLGLKAQIEQKNISFNGLHLFENEIINTDNELFNILIKIYLNNAITFAKPNDFIEVNVLKTEHMLSIQLAHLDETFPLENISDNLFGLQQKHIDKNTGMDLYASILIMRYLCGNIEYWRTDTGEGVLKLNFIKK